MKKRGAAGLIETLEQKNTEFFAEVCEKEPSTQEKSFAHKEPSAREKPSAHKKSKAPC